MEDHLSLIWEEKVWFILTFIFSSLLRRKNYLGQMGAQRRMKKRRGGGKRKIDLTSRWSPAVVPRHTKINYPLLINAIRAGMMAEHCRRCRLSLISVCVLDFMFVSLAWQHTQQMQGNVPVCRGASVPVEQRNELSVLTPGELVLCCHCSLHQLRFNQPGAKPIGIFGVMLETQKERHTF